MIKNTIDKFQESHLSKVVGPGLAAIPCIGGVLSAAWSQWDTERRFKRVESFLSDVASKIKILDENCISKEFGEKEIQLLEEILRRVQVEHREQKRKQFANVLISTWTFEQQKTFENNMRFIRALDEFDDVDIEILKYLKNKKEENVYPNYNDIAQAIGISDQDKNTILIPALNRLATGYGFVRRAWDMSKREGTTALLSNNLSLEGIARRCEHEITDEGSKFLKSIENAH